MTATASQRELTVGVGAAGLATAAMTLNIGPQHPATHGVLRLRIVLDGERIVSAEPVIGYMHRGAEKLFEVRDYRQILVLANRHDWLSAFANEVGVVLAVEAMLGMEVPESARTSRPSLRSSPGVGCTTCSTGSEGFAPISPPAGPDGASGSSRPSSRG